MGVMPTIGERVRDLRQKHGLTSRELSKRAGVSHAYVGHIERGVLKSPGMVALVGIAKALGVSVDELLAPVGSPAHESAVTREAS